jgi:hypothetical protein
MAISVQTVASTGTTEIVQLHLMVSDDDWVGTFDKVEVARSRTLSSGPYESMTAEVWTSARMPKNGGDAPANPVTGPTVVISGTALQLRLNEKDDVTIVFTGTDPLTLAAVAAQIQTGSAQRITAWVDKDSKLVFQTTEPGTGAALRVVGGDAAGVLGLTTVEPDCLTFGKDAHLQLVQGVERYTFTDLRGSSDYFYRTRYRIGDGVSEWSQPTSSGQAVGISTDNLVKGTIQMVRMDGRPLVGALLRIFNRYKTQLVEKKLVAGPGLNGISDKNGLVEFFLVRGTKITVAIDGTDIVRHIDVPTDSTVTVFNLLDPSLSYDDAFTVQVPRIIAAERRSI